MFCVLLNLVDIQYGHTDTRYVAIVVDIYLSQGFSPLAYRGGFIAQIFHQLPSGIKITLEEPFQSPTLIASVNLRSDRWKLTSSLVEA